MRRSGCLGNDEYKIIQAIAGNILLSIDERSRKIARCRKPDLQVSGIFDRYTDNQMMQFQESIEQVLIKEKKK